MVYKEISESLINREVTGLRHKTVKITFSRGGVLMTMLAAIMLLPGCERRSGFETGFGYNSHMGYMLPMGVRSDTDTFSKDDLTLELYFGTYDSDYVEKNGSDPRTFYDREGDEFAFFGLYICDWEHRLDLVGFSEIPDHTAVEDHLLIREIPAEDAFSEEYGFTMGRLRGIEYNHHETVTVPPEFLQGDRGSFVLKLVAFVDHGGEGPDYISARHYIEIDYQMIDQNTIKIS